MSTATADDEKTRDDVHNSFIFLISAAILVVGLRFYAKWKFIRNVGPEDWLCLVALAFAGGMIGLMFREIHYVTNGELDKETDDPKVEGLKSVYGSLLFYYISLFFIKLSFLMQYLRIFPTRKIRLAIGATLALVVIYGSWTFFGTIFFCTPLDSFWYVDKQDWCFDYKQIWIVNGSINIVMDLLIILLPLPGMKALKLPLSQKLGLMLVFALGGLVTVASLIRVLAIVFADSESVYGWGHQPLALWTAIETTVAIICSCLPTLRPLLARLWMKAWRRSDIQSRLRYLTSRDRSTWTGTKGSSGTVNAEFDGHEMHPSYKGVKTVEVTQYSRPASSDDIC